MKSVYLSGPITGCTYEGCVDWREAIAAKLKAHGIAGMSPMRGKDYLKDAGVIDDATASIFTQAIGRDPAIVARDRYDTTKSDFMLVNLLGATRVSIGTMIELGWADAARVPVVLVMEPTGNIHEHGFVRQLSSYRVETIDAAVDLLIAALGEPKAA